MPKRENKQPNRLFGHKRIFTELHRQKDNILLKLRGFLENGMS